MKKVRVLKNNVPCEVGTILVGDAYRKVDPPKVVIVGLTRRTVTLKWDNRDNWVRTFNLTIKEFKESKWTPLNSGLPARN